MRQYIGARYTTKIYQNSQDPGSCEWESGVVYEPLTIVSYQNSSYLSRTSVPANAGAPTVATQYWAQTGFYNGQIAQLQQDVSDLQAEDIIIEFAQNFKTKFAGKKICIYGDSLSSHAYDHGDWTDPFTEIMESVGATVTIHAHPGAHLSDALTYAQNDTTAYDFVIIWIGVNDSGYTPLGLPTAPGTFGYIYTQLLNAIRTSSPNAKIYDFGISYTNNGDRLTDPSKSILFFNMILESLSIANGVIYNTMMNLPNNSVGYNTATSDGTHFTEAYSQSVIFNRILQAIISDSPASDSNYLIQFLPTGLFTWTEASSVSVVSSDVLMDPQGIVKIHVLFDVTTTLTSSNIATFNAVALPEYTNYSYENGQLFGLSNAGAIVTAGYLSTGRYEFNFEYRATFKQVYKLEV